MTTHVVQSIDVAVPVSTAYNQWTQFESFPQFMEGVERIEQLTPTRTHWVTRIASVTREFDAEITEQHPDERVAWRTDEGTHQAGVVTFHRLDDKYTRVTLQLDHEPEGLAEKAADALGVVQKRIAGDLRNFKEFIEARGHEEGAWRGDVGRSPQQEPSGSMQSGGSVQPGTTAPPGSAPPGSPRPGAAQPGSIGSTQPGQSTLPG
jgi:uncharacterized membrane protein